MTTRAWQETQRWALRGLGVLTTGLWVTAVGCRAVGGASAAPEPAVATAPARPAVGGVRTDSVTMVSGPVAGAPDVPPGTRVLRVISFSDFHAALEPRPDRDGRSAGGVVALSAAIEQARAECTGRCTSLVIDGGDMFTGTPASDWDAGRPTVAALNRLRIDAGALGNHEFDFGQDTLRMRLADLAHPVMGANVRGLDGARPRWLRADTILVRNGLRIGVVGAAGTHTATSTKVRNVRDLIFLEPAPILSAHVRALRAAGAEVVVAVIHDGTRCEIDRQPMCDGQGVRIGQAMTDRPDVFVLAHSHTNENLRIGGMPTIQVTSNGRAIGVVDVPLDGGAPSSGIRPVDGTVVEGADPVLVRIVDSVVTAVRPRLERVVATIGEPLPRRGPQHALGNLVADAARTLGNGDFGAWNSAGLRADVRAGPLRFGDVHEVSPFGNLLVRVRLRGSALRSLAERFVAGSNPGVHVSGFRIDYDGAAAVGQRVVRLVADSGADVDPEGIYTIVINDFMLDDPRTGPTGLPTIAIELLPIRDSDAVAEWFRRQPQPVKGPTELRIRAVEVTR